MPRPRFVMLSREGWYSLVILGFVLTGAVMRQINLLMILYGLLVGPLLLNWWFVRRTLSKIDVRRRLPDAVSAGDPLIVSFDVENRRRRLPSWALTVRDTIERVGGGEPRLVPEVLISYLRPRSHGHQSYTVRFARRGKYRFGPLRLSTRFPFGLLRDTVVIDRASEVVVFPRVGRLGHWWHRRMSMADAGSGHVQRRQGTLEGDFYGLREWRSSDSRSWIHWRSSARRQTLIVRQFEQQRKQNVAIVLDLWQPPRPTERDRENVELAVSFAATIVADVARRGGMAIGLSIAAASAQRLQGPASPALAEEMLERLALVEPGRGDQLDATLSAMLRELRPGARVIAISTRPIDLSDTQRFAQLWTDPTLRGWIGRVQGVDVNEPTLGDYFLPE